MARSITRRFDDLLDATTPWYLRALEASATVRELLDGNPRVLDLGCGRGALARWLKGRARYVGVDFDEIAVRENARSMPRADFRAGDVTAPLGLGRFDAVFCINLLPYLSRVAPVFERAREAKEAMLVVVDPVPSPFWDGDWGEFHAVFRTTRALSRPAARCGYRKIEEGRLIASRMAGLPVMAISALTVWTA
jgi:SAM-dependent methyltransferase